MPKSAHRALKVLRRLAEIPSLDRPEGLEAFLLAIDSPQTPSCSRNTMEELLHSPQCGCGFCVGQQPSKHQQIDSGSIIHQCLNNYLRILQSPQVLQAITTYSYAIHDLEPHSAKLLSRLAQLLASPAGPQAHFLINMLDEQTIEQLSNALSRTIHVEQRSIADLTEKLSGRRLTAEKITSIIRDWLKTTESESTVIAIDSTDSRKQLSVSENADWWSFLHPQFNLCQFKQPAESKVELIESELQKAFPANKLLPILEQLDELQLNSFISEEIFYSDAIFQALNLLRERIIKKDGNFPKINIASRHADSKKASQITSRLESLRRYTETASQNYPDKLMCRLYLASLLSDPWKSEKIEKSTFSAIEKLESSATDWLYSLPCLSSISKLLEKAPLILIIDAVSPDVWLSTARLLKSHIPDGLTSWHRLDTKPSTLESLSILFDIDSSEDPTEFFSRNCIFYQQVKGNEQYSIDQCLPKGAKQPLIVRISALDNDAHNGAAHLCDMPDRLSVILRRNLPELVSECTKTSRPLILTTDHGLSLTPKGLLHGRGGVFEQAVFRISWII